MYIVLTFLPKWTGVWTSSISLPSFSEYVRSTKVSRAVPLPCLSVTIFTGSPLKVSWYLVLASNSAAFAVAFSAFLALARSAFSLAYSSGFSSFNFSIASRFAWLCAKRSSASDTCSSIFAPEFFGTEVSVSITGLGNEISAKSSAASLRALAGTSSIGLVGVSSGFVPFGAESAGFGVKSGVSEPFGEAFSDKSTGFGVISEISSEPFGEGVAEAPVGCNWVASPAASPVGFEGLISGTSIFFSLPCLAYIIPAIVNTAKPDKPNNIFLFFELSFFSSANSEFTTSFFISSLPKDWGLKLEIP